MIACSFIFLNCSRVLFNTFARVFLIILIYYIIIIRNELKIFLLVISIPILFSISEYTDTTNAFIVGNVQNVLKMWSDMFRIRCMYFWLLMTTINMFSHAQVYEIYFLYLVLVYFHIIFHHTYVHILCRASAFIRWMEEVFTAFIHINITITWFFFFQRCLKYFPRPRYYSYSKFLYVYFSLVARMCYIDTFQLLPMHLSKSRFNCFIDVSNCFLTIFAP